jgi:hypothetical protein
VWGRSILPWEWVHSLSSNEQPKAHSFGRSPLSRCSFNPAEQCALTLSYSSLSYYSLQLGSLDVFRDGKIFLRGAFSVDITLKRGGPIRGG